MAAGLEILCTDNPDRQVFAGVRKKFAAFTPINRVTT